ncbi:MAG: SGNH/GDSL hydrolase family protein [Mycobacteriales bacterium]
MSDTSRTRTIALAAAGSGSLGIVGVAVTAYLVKNQARNLNQNIPRLKTAPPCEGTYGPRYRGTPIELALIGDSTAAGVGVKLAEQTPGAVLAHKLAQTLARPVHLRCPAVPGARSAGLAEQVAALAKFPADLVLIFIGANDITHRIRPSVAVAHLEQAVAALTTGGTRVVVGTCPDLSSLEGMPAPLRWFTQFWCRELAAAQTIAVVRAGARTVSLADSLRAEFGSRPHELFAEDRFHPSAAGYLRAVEAVLPSLIDVLGYAEDLAPEPSSRWFRIRVPRLGVRRLARAAVAAADTAGTEVTAAPQPADQRGIWGELRNRVAEAVQLARQQLPGRLSSGAVEGDTNSSVSDSQRPVEVVSHDNELIR